MEPKNPPIDKENHLNQTSMNLGFHPLIFWLGFPGWVPNFWWFLRDYKKTLAVGATSAGARVALWKTGSSKAFLKTAVLIGIWALFWDFFSIKNRGQWGSRYIFATKNSFSTSRVS